MYVYKSVLCNANVCPGVKDSLNGPLSVVFTKFLKFFLIYNQNYPGNRIQGPC